MIGSLFSHFLCRLEIHTGPIVSQGEIKVADTVVHGPECQAEPIGIEWNVRQCRYCAALFVTSRDLVWRI